MGMQLLWYGGQSKLYTYLVVQHKAFAPRHSTPVYHKQQIARCREGCHCIHPTTVNDAGVCRVHPVPLCIDHQRENCKGQQNIRKKSQLELQSPYKI
ncbi:hypothetical protein E2C01_001359 [Portunus trituberculatus]|uniref:Uncharacterized protein n=1 Tax=Portunus trituberculatus TaxID=210409 RepID=A0A5B7CK84_PORTR|nr:hypothetical protein [Portunus trituberculatus]